MQKGFDATEFTGEQPVGLRQGGWCAALGALVVDRELDNFLQEIAKLDAG